MWDGCWNVAEERLIFVGFYPIAGFPGDAFRGIVVADKAIVGFGICRVVARFQLLMWAEIGIVQHNLTTAIIEVSRVVVMRMALPVVAKEAVKAAFEWLAGVTRFPKAPLSKASTNVAEVTEELTQNGDVCRDRHLLIFTDILVVTDRCVSGVEACHEDASRWGADRASAVVSRESHATFGELVDVWCGEASLAKAGDIAVAEVICEDEDDVRATAWAVGLVIGTGEHGVGCSGRTEFIPGGITGSLHPNCCSATKQNPRAVVRQPGGVRNANTFHRRR